MRDTEHLNEEHALMFKTLEQLLIPLSSVFPDSEVVIHDLSKIPNSILAIANSQTGRKAGDPATDMLLADAAQNRVRTRLNYRTTLADGRNLRSTTIAIHDSNGTVFAALCINSDTSAWKAISEIVEHMVGETAMEEPATEENFVQTVNELGDLIVDKAIAEQGIPVGLMRKEHKLKVIKGARDSGFFLIRDAADTMARKLGISRFTVYNYLKELEDEA